MAFGGLAAACIFLALTWLVVFSGRARSVYPSSSEQPPVSERMDVRAFKGCLRRQTRQFAGYGVLL